MRRRIAFGFISDLAPIKKDSTRCRLTVFFTGRVQGVGFRHTVKQLVAGFEVTGTVRNLPDGRVEVRAEGLREELTAFHQAIHREGLSGFIQNEQLHWESARNEFRGFEIMS